MVTSSLQDVSDPSADHQSIAYIGDPFHSTDDELIVRTPKWVSYNGDGTAKCTFLWCGKTAAPRGGGDMLAIAPGGRSGAVGK